LGRPDLIALCREPWGPAQAPVRAFLSATFATRTRDAWDEWLSDKGVCYAPVLDMHEAWHAPLLREREMIKRGADGVEHLATPLKFRHEPGDASSVCAELGEHTDSILARLGYDAEEQQRLHAAGVC
jgi:crotonobetainyl-CoA:carnitine CoA-transferase CaiB-like acyl-CoA transferase